MLTGHLRLAVHAREGGRLPAGAGGGLVRQRRASFHSSVLALACPLSPTTQGRVQREMEPAAVVSRVRRPVLLAGRTTRATSSASPSARSATCARRSSSCGSSSGCAAPLRMSLVCLSPPSRRCRPSSLSSRDGAPSRVRDATHRETGRRERQRRVGPGTHMSRDAPLRR